MAGRSPRSLASRIVKAVAVALMIFVAVLVFTAHRIESELDWRRAEAQLTAIIEIIANRSAASLMFRDEQAASRNLSAARFHPDLLSLCLYTLDGDLLGSYLREDLRPPCQPMVEVPLEEIAAPESGGDARAFRKPVRVRGNLVGYLVVDATLESVAASSRRFAVALWVLYLSTVVVTFFAVRWIVNRAFKPLASLRDTASAIARDPYTSARADQVSDDEVGDLVGVFNQMLDRMEEKDSAVKRSEKAVRETQKMRALAQLSGGIAHDFNNILAIGLSGLEVMEMTLPRDSEFEPELKAVKTALMRGAALTKKLAGISKGMPATVQRLDVNDVVLGMEDMVLRAVVPSVNADFDLGEDVGAVMADLGDLQDALLNLVINAKDAMPNGGDVTVSTRRVVVSEHQELAAALPESTEHVCIAVSDNGPGMPPDVLSRVFEPFFSTKEGEHSGLGLAMVYGMADRAGGRVLVDSVQGEGTTFGIYIPVAAGEEPQLSVRTDESAVHGGQETVLLIDDEQMLLTSIQTLLESLGYRVLTASSPEQVFVDEIMSVSLDAVVSDVVMPGAMSGFELVRTLQRKHPSNFVCMFVSGYTGEDSTVPPGWDVAPSILTKPVSGRKLASALRNLLDARAAA